MPEADPASSSVSGSRSYGPVKQGDTLAGIAKNIIGSDAGAGASLNQALIALHRANPSAFIGGNLVGDGTSLDEYTC